MPDNQRVTVDWGVRVPDAAAFLLGLASLAGWVAGVESGILVSSPTIQRWVPVFLGVAGGASLLLFLCSGWLGEARLARARRSEAELRDKCEALTRLLERRDYEIRKQEEELADLFHSATVGLHVQGADGTILNANQAMLDLLGCGVGELVGRNIAAFHMDPATCEEMVARLSRLERLESFPARLRHRDGTVRHVLIDAKARLKDGCFLHVLCFTRDVTERTWADDQMLAYQREVSHLKAALHEHAIVAITDPEGRITYANDNLCAISKYTRQELLGRDHRLLNSGYHSPQFIKGLWDTIQSGRVWKGEIRNRAKDGTYFWVDTTIVPFLGSDNRPMQYFAIHADITPRKQAQLAIETISERLGLATQGSGIGIWDWNIETDTLIWDDMMYRLYGLSPDTHVEVIRAWEEALHPEDRERARAEVQLSVRDQVYDTSFRVVWPDGTVRHIRAHGIVQRDDSGRPVRMTGTNWDITDHRVAEEKLAASLHEKEVLLKEIHHRVKNNMQVVFSLLSLQSEQITDARALKAFRESQNRVKSMALLHEKLYQSENLAGIDFARYLDSLLDHLFSSFGAATAHVERSIDMPNISLGLDTAIPCGLIVNELVSNALKYAFVGRPCGQIQLRMRSQDSGHYHLVVSDDGVGLPKDLDFRQVKTLGLQLVNMLTSQLRGTVECRNGHGTEFHITFHDRQNPHRN